MIKTIIGDLLEANEKYILHQTNCLSTGFAAGLAYYLFQKFSYADCYSDRTSPSEPGAIDIRGNGIDQRYVVNLMGQYAPGSFHDDFPRDTQAIRQKYFHKALIRLAKIPNLESVAFPYSVGCGIAGGNWQWYLGTIKNFAQYIEESQEATVSIYQREEDL
ncbi:MAG TPA: hypothetical protein VHZ50_18755 [Puia sp.]|nr:hypothetical protein [Puia sp.]